MTYSRRTLAAATTLAAALALTGCQGGGDAADAGSLVEDGTFTYATLSDPGSLDPHASFAAPSQRLMLFLYDTLVKEVDGEILPQLAESWTETPTQAVFTLRGDVTCADGTPLTPDDVAANINYVGDPENGSPLVGASVPIGATATVDGDTVTVDSPAPAPFMVTQLSRLPIVCRAGLADRTLLEREAFGTGPYTLTESVVDDHYTLTRRDAYTWGPDGATTSEKGVPATVVFRVINNETTAANLLLAGEINAASVSGPDADRLGASELFSAVTPSIIGEFFYNQAPDRPTADSDLRIALTQALDRDELRTISTSGTGADPQSLIGVSVCPVEDFVGALPSFDRAAATAGTEQIAGTELKMIYSTNFGSGTAETAVAQWQEAGVAVTAAGMSNRDLFEVLYETGDWDIAWFPADGSTPDEVRSNFSGPGPADGGNNFASIDNAVYDDMSQKALLKSGVEGCPEWTAAEESLLSQADVVPFSVKEYPVWGAGATFSVSGNAILPTSVRLSE